MKKPFWQRLEKIDSRVLYALLLVVIAVPLLVPKLTLPSIPSQATQTAFDVVEAAGKAPTPKLAIIDGWWSSSTRGEQQFQTEAIVEHLMRLKIPFAILAGDPQSRQLIENIADQLAPKYRYVYGVNYINWGYKVAYAQTLKGMVNDIPGTLKADANGIPLHNFPIMEKVKSMADVGLIFEITPSSTLDIWLGLVEGVYHTPIIYAPTAVMAPEAYPFLDSGQIKGLILGVKGAGDYEQLLHVDGQARHVATSMSMVYVMIILLIVIGNIGYFTSRLTKTAEEDTA